MSIASRIAAGFFLTAAVLVVALLYQLSVVDRLQNMNRELSLGNLEAARISVHLLQDLEGVREFAAKAVVLDDPEFRETWRDWEGIVEDDLRRLSAVGLAGEEDQARGRIEEAWEAYLSAAASLREDPAALGRVEIALADLHDRVSDLIDTNARVVREQGERSVDSAARARSVAWIAAGAAFLVAALMGGLLYLSISGPLRRLTRGTRELAQGRFEHRLEIRGPGELASLARDFNHMAARLDELDDLKQEFVSHVSHELKTPLAAIQETIEVMLDELPGPLTPKQARFLELSRGSAARLSGMISNLLDLSRLEAGGMAYDPVPYDLEHLAGEVVGEAGTLGKEREVTVSLHVPDGPAPLVCDAARLREVIANLVVNAIRFSPDGGEVRVAISEESGLPAGLPPGQDRELTSREGPFLLLTVEDDGPGVPEAHRERVFEKFHQVKGSRSHAQGVGLGLAIARRIVEAHEGAIWVEAASSGGAAFRVLLQRRPLCWEGVPLEEEAVPAGSSVGGEEPAREDGPAVPDPVSARSLLPLGAALLLGGCASLPWGGGEEPSPSAAEVLPTGEAEVVPAASLEEEILARARAGMVAGRYEEAARLYGRVLALDGEGGEGAEALWGLALAHFHPESPLHERARGLTLLAELETEFPGTVAAVQAGWIRGLFEELAEVRGRAGEQEARAEELQERIEELQERIEELQETIEQLRRIDLERRPTRPPDPPDTLSPPDPPDPLSVG